MKYLLCFALVLSLLLTGCSALKTPTANNNSEQKSADAGLPANEKPSVTLASVKLDLNGQQLKKVPDYVFNQTNLQELNISGNLLTGALQAEIRQLRNLKILNASHNLMTGVPAEIGQLENLEYLNLANNQLTGLPYELGNLKNLKELDISGNNYSELDLNIIKEKLPASVKIIK
jgi:Leucine-rich repeat (LRR) protein